MSGSSTVTGNAKAGLGIPRDIYILSLISFFVTVGFGIIGPAIPLLARQFGVGAAEASLAISAFALFRFISALGAGSLIGRLGERKVLAGGLLVQAITSILAGLAPTFELLLFFRALGGLGSAAFTISSMALLLRLAPADRRGRAMSIYQGGNIMGAIAGPAMGGVLADIAPRLPLLVYGCCLLLAAVVGLSQLDRGRPAIGPAGDSPVEESLQYEDIEDNIAVLEPVHASASHAGPASAPPLDRLFLRIYITALLANLASGWVFYGMRNSLLPLFISDNLHKSAAWTGLAFFLAAVVQGLALLRSGWLTDTAGRKFALVLGLSIGLASLIGFMLPLSATLFLVPMMTFGVAAAFMATTPAAILGDVSQGRGAKMIAGFSMMSDLGAIVGPLASGFVADRFSFTAAFALSAAVVFVALIPALMLPGARNFGHQSAPRRAGAPS